MVSIEQKTKAEGKANKLNENLQRLKFKTESTSPRTLFITFDTKKNTKNKLTIVLTDAPHEGHPARKYSSLLKNLQKLIKNTNFPDTMITPKLREKW